MLTVLHSEASLGWGGQEIRIMAELTGLAGRGHRTGLLASPLSEILTRARAAWGRSHSYSSCSWLNVTSAPGGTNAAKTGTSTTSFSLCR